MRRIATAVSLLGLSLLTACQHFNPLDSARQEKILNLAIINSENYGLIQNAHCTIDTNTSESIDTQLNPDAILLNADYKLLSIDCRAPGYKQEGLAITNKINEWSASDLFVLPPGEIVDFSSSLLPYYPSHILVLMNKKPFASQEHTEAVYKKAKSSSPLYQGMTA